MKRFFLFLLVFVLALPNAAHADDASRHAKAKEMLGLLHMDKMMDQMMSSMMAQMAAMTKQLGGDSTLPPDRQAKADEFQKKVSELIQSQLNWKTMEPGYVDIYSRNFTDEQLDGIIAFYKSPAGVALVEKLPTLTTEGMQMAQAKAVAIQPQLKQMIEEYAKSVSAPSQAR